MYNVDRNTTV